MLNMNEIYQEKLPGFINDKKNKRFLFGLYVKNKNLLSTIIQTHHWQTTDIILPWTVPTESRKNTKKISDSTCFQHWNKLLLFKHMPKSYSGKSLSLQVAGITCCWKLKQNCWQLNPWKFMNYECFV